jgi:ubiquinone/menaquinone biosynthesis C-methylase UbiE
LSRLENKRAKQVGLAICRFQEGDAANLHQVSEQAFELFVSIFGAMFHCAQAV